MDLLFSKYASPLEFMNLYIEQGRFGEFVSEILQLEAEKQQKETEKENDDRLWLAYLMSMSDKSFSDWKKGLYQKKEELPQGMTDQQVEKAKAQAHEILQKVSPL